MAFGQSTVTGAGNAVSDIFAGFGTGFKRAGDEAEAAAYTEAANLALKNEQFTKMSTAIQEAQSDRELYLNLGKTKSEVAGAGFAEGGSALDILRSSASQGSLQKAVIGEQGLIQEAGYQEQAQAYETMATALNNAAKGESLAQIGDFVGAGFSALGSIVSLIPGK